MLKFIRQLGVPKTAGLILWTIIVLTLLIPSENQWKVTSSSSSLKKIADHPLKDRQDFRDLLELQAAFIRNAKAIKPSVVSINRVKEVIEKSSWPHSDPDASRPWFGILRDWIKSNVSGKQYLVENVGSGLVYNPNGYILTNYHVIEDLDRIMVKMANGRDYFAKVVGSDPLTDLAVIKINSIISLVTPRFGKSEPLQVGEWVMAIGNPYGLEGTVTVGVVSGKGRTDLGITTFENFIQTDASINPGNSGGPLINMAGEIVGINTAVAQIGSGVGFAIPIEMAMQIGDQLIKKGQIDRGWLGVAIQSMTPELAQSFSLSFFEGGVLVSSVNTGAPANRGGILRGDIIIQFDGQKVSGSKKFQQMVAETQIGKMVPIKVIRDGLEKTLRIKIGRYTF